ncbi:MAG TPA: methionine gamma-lyase family protein [Limnochordales bacterium]|nr:methionine gamma-lyase family protein [Limnochordales bacterium]
MSNSAGRQAEEIVQRAREAVQPQWAAIAELERRNVRKVLAAFHQARVGEEHFAGSTGYGYHDIGRQALEQVYAQVFGAEAALVRPQIASGTHAISACLFGLLRPGDHLLSASGRPYETLQQVIAGPRPTSLRALGVEYSYVPLLENGDVDLPAVLAALRPNTRVVLLQRSRGYTWRPALSVARIGEVVAAIKARRPDVICFVDNCYGEFVEDQEPLEVGADIMAGSLIKNPGGGLAPAGGYVAGRAELVSQAADRVTAPGLGDAVGPTLRVNRDLFYGFFQAPHVVAEALCGAVLAAQVFASLGFAVAPRPDEPRADVVQAIRLGSADALLLFCRAVQESGPVDAHVTPVPGPVPGYDVPVVMAGGTFIQGSSIELSADGPLRPPYDVFMQGGLSREHVHIALTRVIEQFLHAGFLPASVPTY